MNDSSNFLLFRSTEFRDAGAAYTTMPAEEPARPFLRWAGGKTRLLSAILPYVPSRFNRYHEPFLGSGAMFFAVRQRAKESFLSDLNSELINLWRVVQRVPKAFVVRLEPYVKRQGEAAYYEVRAEQPTGYLDRAARFFYLNQTAWNGLWRENKWGVFNVPYGARSFRGIDRESLLAAHRATQNALILRQDFREALSTAKAGDFVYLDPPYLPVSDTSKFAGYNGERFRRKELEELAALCKELSRRRVSWVLSNRDNELVRGLFAHARIVPFTTRRSVAAQNKRHVQPKESPEVIVVGGPN